MENIIWKCGKLDEEFQCGFCDSYLKFPVKFQDCNHLEIWKFIVQMNLLVVIGKAFSRI